MSSVDNRIVRMQFDNSSFERKVSTTLNTLEKLKSKFNFSKAEDSFKGITIAAGQVDFSKAEEGVNSFTSKLSTLGIIGTTALVNLTNSAVNAGKKIVNSVIGPLTSGGWTRAMNIEQAKFKLQGLGVAGKDLELVWQNVTDAVDGTAYSLDAAALVAAQFAASGMRGGDNMAKSLRAVSGVAAVTGSSYDDIGRIFTQVAGQGRLMGDQLLQLSGRGMNAAATLAKYLGKSEAEVRDMVSKGKIDFQTFADCMNDAFGDQAKKANNTLTGVLSNVRSALAKIGADFVTPFITNTDSEGHVSNLVELLNAVRESINEVRKSLEPFRKAITEPLLKVIQNTTNWLKKFNEATTPVTKTMKTVSKVVKTTTGSFRDLEKIAKQVINGEWGNGANRINSLTKAGKNYNKVQSMVNDMLKGTYDSSKYATEGVSKVTEEVVESTERLENWRDAIAHGFGNLVNVIVKPLDAIFSAFGETFQLGDSVNVVNSLANAFGRLTEKLVPSNKMLESLKSIALSVFQVLKLGLSGSLVVFRVFVRLAEVCIDVFRNILESVMGLGAGIAKFLTSPIRGLNSVFKEVAENNNFIVAVKKIKDSITTLRQSFTSLHEKIQEAFSTILNSLGGPFKIINEWISDFKSNLKGGLVNLIVKVTQKIADCFDGLAKVVGRLTGSGGYSIQKWAKTSGVFLEKWVAGPAGKLLKTVGFIIAAIGKFTISSINNIKEWFNKTSDPISKWVSKTASGFYTWIKGPASKVGSVFASMTTSIKNWFNATYPAFSTWCKEVARNFGEWFKETVPKFKEWCDTVYKHIKKWADEVLPIITKWTKDAFDVIKAWSSDVGPTLQSWTNTTITTIGKWGSTVYDIIKKVLKDITNLVTGKLNFSKIFSKSLGESVQNVTKYKSQFKFDFGSFFSGMFSNATESINSGMRKLTYNSTKTLKTAGMSLSKVFKTSFFEAIYDFTKNKVSNVLETIGSAIDKMTTTIADGFDKVPIDKIKIVFSTLINGALGLAGTKALVQLGNMFESFGNIGTSIKGFVDSWKRVEPPKPTKMNQFNVFAKSLAILAVSLSLSIGLLSLVDAEKGWTAIGEILALVSGMSIAMVVIGKCIKKWELNAKDVAQPLIKMALAMAILAIPISIFSTMELSSLGIGLGMVAAGIVALSGGISLIGHFSKNLKKSASAILSMAVAMTLLIIPIKVFSAMNLELFYKGLVRTALGLTALTASVATIGHFSKNLKRAASSIFSMAAALTMLIIPVTIFGHMNFDKLRKGLITTASGMIVMSTSLLLLSRLGKYGLKDAAKSIAALAASITMLIIPVTIFGALPYDVLSQGLGATAIGIITLTAALAVLSAIGGEATIGATSILGLAAAILVLIVPITIMGMLPWETLKTGLLGMGLALSVLILAGAGAMAVSAGLTALSLAALSLTGSMALGAAAIWLIASAISKVADLAPGAGQKLVDFLSEFAAELAAKGFEMGMNLMAGILEGLIGGIAGVFKGIFDIGGNILNWFGEVLGIHSPSEYTKIMGLFFDQGFMNGIDEGSGNVLGSVENLGNGSLQTLIPYEDLFAENGLNWTSALRDNLDAGQNDVNSVVDDIGGNSVDTLSSYGDGFGTIGSDWAKKLKGGIENSQPELNQAMNQSGKETGESFVMGAEGSTPQIEGISAKQAQAYQNGMASQIDNIKAAASQATGSAISGIDQNTEAFRSAGSRAMNCFINGISQASNSTGDKGVAIIQGILNSINSKLNEFSTAGSNLINQFVVGMQLNAPAAQQALANILNTSAQNIAAKGAELFSAGSALVDQLASGIQSKNGYVINLFNTVLDNVINKINSKARQFQSAGANCASKVLTGLKSKNSSMKEAINLQGAIDGIKSYYSAFESAGKYMAQGFAQGISEETWRAEAKARAMADKAYQAAKKQLDMNSPSKVMIKVGKYFGQGFAVGIQDATTLSDKASTKMADRAVSSLRNSISRIKEIIENEISTDPVIRPVMDLSDVEAKAKSLSRMTAFDVAGSINTSMNAQRSFVYENQNGMSKSQSTSINFTQNNYSPKALSRLEIYRDTKNQFAQFKKMVNA